MNRRPVVQSGPDAQRHASASAACARSRTSPSTSCQGEIHALLGENGAGKSTILKILQRRARADAGTIEVDGAPLTTIHPEALARGRHRHDLPGDEPGPDADRRAEHLSQQRARTRLRPDRRQTAAPRSRELFRALGVDIDPTAMVADLSAGQRQLTEIVKAISRTCKVLILDEPTTALSRRRGRAAFRLPAPAQIARAWRSSTSRTAWTRSSGSPTARRSCATATRRHRAAVEFTLERSSSISSAGARAASPTWRGRRVIGEPLLELRGVCGPAQAGNVDLTLHRGEVVGVAGLLGSGRSALARVLFGIDPQRSGEIRVKGRPVKIQGPEDAIAAGIALVPEDRLRQGFVLEHIRSKAISDSPSSTGLGVMAVRLDSATAQRSPTDRSGGCGSRPLRAMRRCARFPAATSRRS